LRAPQTKTKPTIAEMNSDSRSFLHGDVSDGSIAMYMTPIIPHTAPRIAPLMATGFEKRGDCA
jgi:hypothetical protein